MEEVFEVSLAEAMSYGEEWCLVCKEKESSSTSMAIIDSGASICISTPQLAEIFEGCNEIKGERKISTAKQGEYMQSTGTIEMPCPVNQMRDFSKEANLSASSNDSYKRG